jgi:hypothetical protein
VAVRYNKPIVYLTQEDMYADPAHKQRQLDWALVVNPKPSEEERKRLIEERMSRQVGMSEGGFYAGQVPVL